MACPPSSGTGRTPRAVEPVSVHRSQKPGRDLGPRPISDDAVDPAAGTQSRLSFAPGVRVYPFLDQRRLERRAAVEAPTDRTGQNLGSVARAVPMRLANGGRQRRNPSLVLDDPVWPVPGSVGSHPRRFRRTTTVTATWCLQKLPCSPIGQAAMVAADARPSRGGASTSSALPTLQTRPRETGRNSSIWPW